jgi:hypothetical protein
MLRVLGAGPNSELAKTIDKFTDQRDRIKTELSKFLQWKNKTPYNGSLPGFPGFGDSDKKFRSGGNFGSRLPGISHAHVTHNLSIVYFVDRETNTIRLYGVYSHDDIGTGSPPDLKRQEQMGSRWANMKFDASIQPTALNTSPKAVPTKVASQGKPDYAPKLKQPVTSTPTQEEESPLVQMSKQVDSFWPDRNLYKQLQNARSKTEQLAVINGEVNYINVITKRHSLYPNQMQYVRGLQALYNALTKK